MEPFRFQHFALCHEASTQRIGTDSVLLAALMPLQGVHSVLDIGCGCGVIGFCVADRLRRAGVENIRVAGIDIDAASVREAQENAARFPDPEWVKFHFSHESLQEHTHQAEAHLYDLIAYPLSSLRHLPDKQSLLFLPSG